MNCPTGSGSIIESAAFIGAAGITGGGGVNPGVTNGLWLRAVNKTAVTTTIAVATAVFTIFDALMPFICRAGTPFLMSGTIRAL